MNNLAVALPASAWGAPNCRASIRKYLSVAMFLSSTLVVGIGGWATFTMISGAVIAPGQLVVESNVKKVQHPTGGVVGELRVQEGQTVKAGDILVRLDETQTRANLDVVLKALDELAARGARDEAERDGLTNIVFPASLLARKSIDATVSHLVDGETRLFASRVKGREGQKAQLSERVMQVGEEIKGLTQQADAKDKEIAFIHTELTGLRELFAKNLVPLSRVTVLERDAARLEGERGQLVAQIASAKGKIAEIELQILQIDQDMRNETGKDLAEIRGKWSEYVEKRIAAEDLLKRIDLRAPQDGTVHQMTVHTIGGLVTPNEPAMLIVPTADQLAVEARIQPHEIDSVHLGQKASLRFSAFNQRTTPEIEGSVSRISPDVSSDPKTGVSFYTIRIHVGDEQQARLGGVRLVAGMPVDSFIQLESRSVLSYLTKPLADQIAKAWRER